MGSVERERFIREAKAASALNHPNIVTIYEYGTDNGVDFIAMEHIQGATLTKLPGEGPVPLEKALNWSRQLAGALSIAHAAGIVHRDLKPGNVMVWPNGILKILDFGIATRRGNAAGVAGTAGIDLTLPGAIIGTPSYMSPEQARVEQVDFRSDIFSFGTMLYEFDAPGHSGWVFAAGNQRRAGFGAFSGRRPILRSASCRQRTHESPLDLPQD